LSHARPTTLVVVSSSCQLYSGTGKALFDWIREAKATIDFSLLIDDGDSQNFNIAATFCKEVGIRFYPSRAEQVPGCPDHCPIDVAAVLQARDWDFVECVSWASAATNLQVLESRPRSSRLLYTPHTQPLWTLPGHERFFMVQPVFLAMLKASDMVFVDTPSELEHIDASLIGADRTAFIPLGVDTQHFCPSPDDPPAAAQCFSVSDFREHRKRPDLLYRAFGAIAEDDPAMRLVLAGKGSSQAVLPPALAARATPLGYIDDATLLHHYRQATVFLLMSDFEAFGLPIAEALCCGTPVITTWQKQTARIFGDLPGVYLVDNTDIDAIRAAVQAVHRAPASMRLAIAQAAAGRFGYANTYAQKSVVVGRLQPDLASR
jgi:glycosyltransferase involved in cell wall biosynthesis